jgi:hypothetical protein
MDCPNVEERLSEYMERSLPAADVDQVAEHLEECRSCSAILREMQSILSLCKSFPSLGMDPDLAERILLRTSGRPRTRSFRELIKQYFARPLLTPRFALGTGLATLFVVLLINTVLPRVSTVASALEPSELFGQMDRGVQQLYGKWLRAYDKKNDWQAQFTSFKDSIFDRLGVMIEQLDVPVEGRKKSEESVRPPEKAPKENSSGLHQLAA